MSDQLIVGFPAIAERLLGRSDHTAIRWVRYRADEVAPEHRIPTFPLGKRSRGSTTELLDTYIANRASVALK